ncbi:anaerobic C4-dicarboxylate transporter family protein [Escherichia coli]|nr:anaerobic C4-dicarboxylate transporter family protein [Escherichia coli]
MAAIVTSFSVYKRGKELEDDPEFQRRVAAGEYEFMHTEQKKEYVAAPGARKGVAIFAIGVVLVLILGSFTELLPSWDGKKIINPNGHPDDYVDCSFIDHDCGESSKQ